MEAFLCIPHLKGFLIWVLTKLWINYSQVHLRITNTIVNIQLINLSSDSPGKT